MEENLEEKVLAYKALRVQLDDLEKRRKKLSEEIVGLIPKEQKVMTFSTVKLKWYCRLSISTPLEAARALGAVKMQEVIDKDQLKKLHAEGLIVPNVHEVYSLHISELNQEAHDL